MEKCYKINNFPTQSYTDEELRNIPSSNTAFNNTLKKYVIEGDVLNAEKIQEDWFPEMDVDIFISHSHRNCPDLIEFANKMEKKGLSCFIDSITWGYADDLLNQLDKAVCWNRTSNTFDYSVRNNTTALVHILLNTSLLKMIDKCKYVFFFNTNVTVPRKDLLKSFTYSPWIFSEISMCNAILEDRKRAAFHFKQFSVEYSQRQLLQELKAALPLNFDNFIDVEYVNLNDWITSSQTDEESLISVLDYAISSGRQLIKG